MTLTLTEEPNQTTIGNALPRRSELEDKRPGKGFLVRVRLEGWPLQLALAGSHVA